MLKQYKNTLEYFKHYYHGFIKLGLKFSDLAKMWYYHSLEDVDNTLKKLEKKINVKKSFLISFF